MDYKTIFLLLFGIIVFGLAVYFIGFREKKIEEFQTIIMAQASEIADLKRCLQDLLASQPPLMSTESQKNPLDTQVNRAKIFQNQKIAVLVLYNM